MAKIFQIPNKIPEVVKVPILPSLEKGLNVLASKGADTLKQVFIASNYIPNDFDINLKRSKLGTPIYSEVVIKKTQNTIVREGSFSGQDYVRFDTCIVTVNQQRNIVKTAISGRNGTVKEYISDGDYSISIKGSILGDAPDKMPIDILTNSRSLFTEPNELWIECEFIRMFGISYVVIENYTIDQVEGSRSRVDFNIQLISDEPTEVKLGIKE